MAKNPGGRPTKYYKEMCNKLPDMFKNGESVVEVCVNLEIHIDTFYDWIKKYPKFSDAYKRGRMLSQAWWEKLGRGAAAGLAGGHPAYFIFQMKNRFRKNLSETHPEIDTRWVDKIENENNNTSKVELENKCYAVAPPVAESMQSWEKDAKSKNAQEKKALDTLISQNLENLQQ
jgi:hypothetical protein